MIRESPVRPTRSLVAATAAISMGPCIGRRDQCTSERGAYVRWDAQTIIACAGLQALRAPRVQ